MSCTTILVGKNASYDGSTTIAKGDVTYTFTPESYECVTGTGETIELTHYCYVRDGFTYIPMDFAKTL